MRDSGLMEINMVKENIKKIALINGKKVVGKMVKC